MFIQELKERERFMIWRKRNKVNLTDVAKYCGCATSTISQFENSQTKKLSDKFLLKYQDYIYKYEKGEIK